MSRITLPFIGTFTPYDARSADATRRTVALIERHGIAAFGRDPQIGHCTASGFVLSRDRRETLLMHHRKLARWLQPGGHCDGETDVRAAATREVAEETGLAQTQLLEDLFDIDVHQIPARKGEPAHLHYDLRFLFIADRDAPLRGNVESTDLAWFTRARLLEEIDAPSVRVVASVMES